MFSCGFIEKRVFKAPRWFSLRAFDFWEKKKIVSAVSVIKEHVIWCNSVSQWCLFKSCSNVEQVSNTIKALLFFFFFFYSFRELSMEDGWWPPQTPPLLWTFLWELKATPTPPSSLIMHCLSTQLRRITTRMSAHPVYGHVLLFFQKISQVNKRIFSIHLKVFFPKSYTMKELVKKRKSTKMVYWNM